jgi:hypothetical protein
MDNARVLNPLILKSHQVGFGHLLIELLNQLWLVLNVFVVKIKLLKTQGLARINFELIFLPKLLIFQKKHISGVGLLHSDFNSTHAGKEIFYLFCNSNVPVFLFFCLNPNVILCISFPPSLSRTNLHIYLPILIDY